MLCVPLVAMKTPALHHGYGLCLHVDESICMYSKDSVCNPIHLCYLGQCLLVIFLFFPPVLG